VLSCTACGRYKGTKFPLDASGKPLLINPLEENPWEHLEFDPTTGCLTTRYLMASSAYSIKGSKTNKWLQTENRQWLTDRYLLSYNDLKDEIEAFLSNPMATSQVLFGELEKADKQDILEWLLLHNGQQEPFCQQMQSQHALVWSELQVLYTDTFLRP